MFPPLDNVSVNVVRKKRQYSGDTDRPKMYALRPKTHDATAGQKWQFLFYPTPDAEYNLDYSYRVEPSMLDATNKYPLGSAEIGELILLSCLAIAEQRYKDEKGIHTEEFENKLADAIEQDGNSFAPDTIGYNGDNSDGQTRDPRWDSVATHSFEGTYYYDA